MELWNLGWVADAMNNPAATVLLRTHALIGQRPFPHAGFRVVLLIALSATIIATLWVLSLASLHIETARLLDSLTQCSAMPSNGA